MIIKKSILVTMLLLCCVRLTSAQSVIANRNALNTLLGDNRIDEGFESINLADGSGQIGEGLLSSSNSWGGWPLGLVNAGITIESTGTTEADYWIRWNGNNSGGGSTTKTILAGPGISLDFWFPTAAFGLDLKDYTNLSLRLALTAGITIYGADDVTVLYQNNSFNITDPANGNFFGFESSSGIGRVLFTTTLVGSVSGYTPLLDNITYSTSSVPEPSTLAVAALGLSVLVLRFRKS